MDHLILSLVVFVFADMAHAGEEDAARIERLIKQLGKKKLPKLEIKQ